MHVTVVSFGKIADVLGSKRLSFEAVDTDDLQKRLIESYPTLKNNVFAIAVNRQVVSVNTPLPEDAEVALLPPFSGG